jgi:hypothetical protein
VSEGRGRYEVLKIDHMLPPRFPGLGGIGHEGRCDLSLFGDLWEDRVPVYGSHSEDSHERDEYAPDGQVHDLASLGRVHIEGDLNGEDVFIDGRSKSEVSGGVDEDGLEDLL